MYADGLGAIGIADEVRKGVLLARINGEPLGGVSLTFKLDIF